MSETEWVIVPREPDIEMLRAGNEELSSANVRAVWSNLRSLSTSVYKSMLAAAPSAPSVGDVMRQVEAIRQELFGDHHNLMTDGVTSALTAQVQRIETLERDITIYSECLGKHTDAANEQISAHAEARRVAEATVTELRAEVERYKEQAVFVMFPNNPLRGDTVYTLESVGDILTRAETAEARVERLTGERDKLATDLGSALDPDGLRAFQIYQRMIAAESALETARGALEPMQAVVDAARCIQHWHDTNYNPATGETEGMVVSAEHVKKLWSALAALPSPARG